MKPPTTFEAIEAFIVDPIYIVVPYHDLFIANDDIWMRTQAAHNFAKAKGVLLYSDATGVACARPNTWPPLRTVWVCAGGLQELREWLALRGYRYDD